MATITGLLAIRIAIGEKDEAATNEGAVAWLAHQPFGKFLLVALTVALFALALWRFLCAAAGDPVEGREPKDRLKYAVLGVIYLLLAITTLGVTIANWTRTERQHRRVDVVANRRLVMRARRAGLGRESAMQRVVGASRYDIGREVRLDVVVEP